jgi:hypothetical protein
MIIKYFRKKEPDEIRTVETEVWQCTNSACLGWMRMEFALEEEPVCPLCQNKMAQGLKTVPALTMQTV